MSSSEATPSASAGPSNAASAAGPAGRAQVPEPKQLVTRLIDDKLDLRAKLVVAGEIKDMSETYQGQDLAAFINVFVPVALAVLGKMPCSLHTDAPEQRIRNCLLSTLHRLQPLEAARQHAKELQRAMIALIREDNEENAIIALKVIIDLVRAFKGELESEVGGFLSLMGDLYKGMEATVQRSFESEAAQLNAMGAAMGTAKGDASADSPAGAPSPAAESQAASMTGSDLGLTTGAQPAPKVLVKGTSSFKLLQECPIAIVLVVQTFRSTVQASVRVLVPLMIEGCLRLQAAPQRDARTAAVAKGQLFIGVAPGIKNHALYGDLIGTQVKMMSFLAYVIKPYADLTRPYYEELPGISVRLLQDCPPDASATRKELLVAIRHLLSTEMRSFFISQVDTLLDDRVMTGTGVTSRESLRPLAVSMLADLLHHIRPQLSFAQICRVVQLHVQILHHPTLAPSIQTMCIKLLLNITDQSVMRGPEDPGPVLQTVIDALVEKLGALPQLKEGIEAVRKAKADATEAGGPGGADAVLTPLAIERARTVPASAMLPDLAVHESFKDVRYLLRNILNGLKALLTMLRRRKVPEPSGEMMGRVFVDGMRCWTCYEQGEGPPDKDLMENFASMFIELEPQTFHEVFTTHMPFLFELMLTNPVLLGIPQTLLSNEGVSRRYVGIMLRFLVDRLDELGDADKKHASVTLRLFKMSFMAVTIFPEENEAVLQPHLSHLIMQSMKLASKASEPANYFLLLRALFRSIGGGRFELLYKDVLPLLPVLLENLNNLLNAAEPSRRELFVDLCLTVPVRLSVLLPYLGYLMRPLVLALQSSTELVSQGLRTLELCIDNLTQEFLDPIMAPYATDIMTALLKHLQPLPHNHQHSHTTMRILGKMGGRNRRLLQQPPKLTYHDHPQATFTVHFEGKAQSLVLAPVIDLALSGIRRGDLFRRKHSFELLRHAAALFLDGTLGNAGGEREQAFERVVKGLFDATHSEEGGAGLEGATAYLRGLSRHIFTLETRREVGTTRQPGPLMTYFMQGIAYALAANDNEAADAAAIVELELQLIGDAREVCVEASRPEQWITLMHSLASKHCTLCYDQLWQRKTGGWLAIDMMVRRANLGVPWLREHQLEIMRALLYMLKDMPTDPPGNVDAVGETILFVLRTVHTATPAPAAASTPAANGAASEPAAKSGEAEKTGDAKTPAPAAAPKATLASSTPAAPAPAPARSDEELMQERQFNYLVGVLVLELSSSNAKVRSVARASFELLAELRGTSVTTILTPIKERLLQPIFSKPLRALPFGMQIGHIDAVTFCLQLTPPLPEPNEELFRVLTEALALADADDIALIGRTSQYKNMLAVINLRVVALRLLASAMACQDFLSAKHAQLRIRIIAVYFKSLYSPSQAVVDEAYKSLKETLASQPKLPKDVLQSGLRPILMTLADAQRLTVAGLNGLARLLELLTSYFKVEIGSKLLSHMEAIADREVLERAGEGALQGPSYADAHHLLQPRPPRSSDAIETLAAVVRVFHLLPPTASMFMSQLVKQVCDIETVLRRSGPTPFTKPLAQYFDKYPREAVELFFARLEDARYVRCFKLTLACDDAPRLRKQVEEDKSTRLLPLLAGDVDPRKTLAALQVVRELETRQPGWIVDHVDIIEALLVYWRSPSFIQRRANEKGTRDQRVSVQIVDIFTAYLSRRHHTDVYFAFADLASFPGALDLTGTVRFVYQRLAIEGALADRRAVLMRCIDVFERKDVTQAYKAECFRLLANPILIAAPRPSSPAEAESKASAGDSKDAAAKDAAAKDATAKADEPAKAKEGEKPAATPAEPLFHVDLLNTVVQRVWRVFQTKVGAQVCSEDVLRLEIIQFSTMVLEHCEQLMSTVQGAARKDAIKFGWANLATEDITVKTTSYIFIARFLASFDAPFKIVAKVFMGLLRLHQSESRGLVRKALDILVPALPKRVPAAEPGQPSQWAKWTKRQLTEEGQHVAQIGLIFGLLVRHADLFYADRELFMGHIASNLSKLGLSSSSSVESRSLCVELLDVVARWERRRAEALAQTEGKADGAGAAGDAAAITTRKRSGTASGSLADASEPQKRARIDDAGSAAVRSTSPAGALPSRSDAAEHQYTPPPAVRDALLGFLLRFVSLSAEPISLRGTTAKAFNTLRDLLAAPGWSNVPIRLAVFQKPLTSLEVQDSTLVVLTNSLQALRAVIKDKSEAWLLLHVAQLHRLLEKCASAEQPVILENCRDTLERIFAVLPEPAPGEEDAEGDDEDDAMADAAPAPAAPKQEAEPQQPEESAAAFRTFADRIIAEGLRSNGAGLYGAFVMLASWAKARPEKIDTHLGALTKALTKLTKDHLGMPAQQSAAAGVQPPPPPPTSDNGLKLLMMVLDLLKTRISNLGEQRRWFLSAVVQLIEKSSSLDLCRFLLTMMRRWILDQAEAFPTVKEKAGILIKMMSFETRDEMLLRDYLDLIHAIYASPTFSRTELTVRLENAFLLGCRQRDPLLRQRFIDIFDRTLVRSLPARLNYLLGNQSWEYLADTYWIHQALDLCLGSVEGERPLLVVRPQAGAPDFVNTLRGLTAGGVITPLRALLYTDATCTHRMWVSFFRAAWRAMPRKSQEDVTRSLIGTLTREHNLRQVSRRPNVVQTLLEGALACTPRVELPPQVVKYLGKTFNAWHTSMELLQDLLAWLPREDDSIREACQDALAELYAELSEDDMFYGLWRRRCVYAETNAAISYEQCGMWAQAQIMYETAQVKARTGVLTFTEAEYSLWEDHWVICAQKLQQWDILTDLAKLEGNNDLLLECAWRLSDWVNERDILEQALDSLSTTATPRRRVFAAYMSLLKSQTGMDKPADFGRICDEAIQLALRKWHSLPTAVTQAHVPLLQIFQQLVELQEASTIFASLAVTNATNLDPRSTELKQLMQTWRERLPNRWDDINAWSDLVAWRQHVFSAVNKAYLPLVPQIQQNGATSSSTNSYAYRGYHETAWIVNRFAHVARKHYLNDVCISSLTKIYTLPNIEIQEAFLKLREQAKCHYRNPAELNQGLEVINNTNLMFFAAPQKAEFFTLKGMFMAKLSLLDEANHAFATAIQMDLNLAKAWTEWGRYNDRLFREQPLQMIAASSAVSCYLQAAGLYKSSKVRKVLIRVLWLLSCDDAAGSVAMAFEGFRGEAPIWYWITFIPQLLQALQHREAKYARRLLMQIAKTFPQSLYFFLRTTREDYLAIKRQSMMAAQRAAQMQARQQQQQLLQQQQAQRAQQAAQQQQQQQQQQASGTAAANSDASTKEGTAPATAEASAGDKAGTPSSSQQNGSGSTAGQVPASTSTPTATPAAASSPAGNGAAARPSDAPGAAATPSKSGPPPTNGAAASAAASATPAAAPAPAEARTTAAPSPAASSAPASQPAVPAPVPTPAPQPTAQPGNGVPNQGSPPGMPPGGMPGAPGQPGGPPNVRQPWEYVDEILNILKTAFPLLALTMENTAEQIGQRFKPGTDEDMYRLIGALLNDALQQYVARASIPNDPGQLPQMSMANVMRFAESLPVGPLKNDFEEDFVKSKPSLREYVHRLQRWRDNYEVRLDVRPTLQHLEHCSHYLVEFQHQRFDDVELPGQYLRLEDNNSDFVKIARFSPTFELTRSNGMCTRRLSILSNKGSMHSFAVQLPSARYCRREERIIQLLRLLNRVLERRKETRKRGLVFTTPAAVPLSPQLRLVESDASFVSLQDVYERHCEAVGFGKEDPIIAWVEKMRSVADASRDLVNLSNLRMDLLDEISTKMVPETVLTRYMTRSMDSPSDLWLMRKQFTLQMASTMFLTYAFFISARGPGRIHMSRSSGIVAMSDVVPTFSPTTPQFKSNDPTPFRLTPNLQHFIGPTAIEGVVTASLMAIGRCLSEPERDLEEYLSIFVRDELNFWLASSQRHPPGVVPEAPRDIIYPNILEMVKRARLLSCEHEASKPQPTTVPVSQTVLDLINSATNSGKLALQEPTWHPWM